MKQLKSTITRTVIPDPGKAVSLDGAQLFIAFRSTIPWGQVITFDDSKRPVGYVAKGSHGLWATAGTFTYVDAVIFQLKDETGNGGVAWDTKDSIVPMSYPDLYSGLFDWLNFRGIWGNKGDDSCWWHFIYPEVGLSTCVDVHTPSDGY